MTLANDLRRHNSGVLRARAANAADRAAADGACTICGLRARNGNSRICRHCTNERKGDDA